MIRLNKLTPNDFGLFKSWIESEEELVQFSGTIFTYPLNDEQLNKYINNSQRRSYKVISTDTDETIGHVELNLENEHPRLSRLIIGNKEYRNKGLGKEIILKLLEKAFIEHHAKYVDVNVYDWNMTALKSYQKVGFHITPEESYSHELNFKIWTAINMCITQKRWLSKNHLFIKDGQALSCVNFSPTTHKIKKVVKTWKPKLSELSKSTITTRRNSQNRSIKQILGHLIDSASNNHQRLVRLQYNTTLAFPDYKQDDEAWVNLQDYQGASWKNMLQLWKAYNLHLTKIVSAVDQSKLNNSWKNYDGGTRTLQQVIEGYYDHIILHLNEIQDIINGREASRA